MAVGAAERKASNADFPSALMSIAYPWFSKSRLSASEQLGHPRRLKPVE
jgi:hypothetical protein